MPFPLKAGRIVKAYRTNSVSKMDVDPGQRPFFIEKLKRNDFSARTKSVSMN